MKLFTILLLTVFSLLLTSCAEPQKIQKITKVTKITKKMPKRCIKPLPSLEESLAKIDAHIGDTLFIRIFKQEKILELFLKVDGKFKLCKTYPICAYSGELGPKLKQGDKQSPEGFYTITKKQLRTKSNYHLAINLGFPNQYDKYQNRTGSYLMIHGKCSSTGCYAMRNEPIEEIFLLANSYLDSNNKSFPVHIFPFKMTTKNMKKHQANIWYPFWKNLKLGYDIFERYNTVPIVKASKEKYKFYIKQRKGNDG